MSTNGYPCYYVMMLAAILASVMVIFVNDFKIGLWWTSTFGGKARPSKANPQILDESPTITVSEKQQPKNKARNVCCQSQAKGNMDLATPRFQPLPEYAHEAFVV